MTDTQDQVAADQARVDAAAERASWHASPERRQFRRVLTILFVAFGSLGAALGWIWTFGPETHATNVGGLRAAIGYPLVGIVSGLYVATGLSIIRLQYARRVWRDRELLAKAKGELAEAEAALATSTGDDVPTDFASLWSVTQKRLDYYHQIATSQSQRSFVYGQVAAGVGLALILVCAVLAALAKNGAATVGTALLGAAGGGLAGYVGTTFMKSQETASQQLRAYFLQPLEFSRVLAAERLMRMVDDDTRRTDIIVDLVRGLARQPADGPPEPRQ